MHLTKNVKPLMHTCVCITSLSSNGIMNNYFQSPWILKYLMMTANVSLLSLPSLTTRMCI
jgi:hypothetical protein